MYPASGSFMAQEEVRIASLLGWLPAWYYLELSYEPVAKPSMLITTGRECSFSLYLPITWTTTTAPHEVSAIPAVMIHEFEHNFKWVRRRSCKKPLQLWLFILILMSAIIGNIIDKITSNYIFLIIRTH